MSPPVFQITVGEMLELLSDLPPDQKVYFSSFYDLLQFKTEKANWTYIRRVEDEFISLAPQNWDANKGGPLPKGGQAWGKPKLP